MQHDLGLIGLAVMGKNLVLNIERNGFSVAVHNRSAEKIDDFVNHEAKGKKITGYATIRDFIKSLKSPRKVLVMVKAGKPVDELINQIIPELDAGDLLIDCGNSLYQDTERRYEKITRLGFRYLGMGVSGGEEGALWGPSIMPGGDREAFQLIEPVLRKISADSDTGPCFTYVGAKSAGHFVKMVHNGIEYGDMQLIAESYDLIRRILKKTPPDIAAVFEEWNQGPLQSYLIEITSEVLSFKEPGSDIYLIDQILDKAGQKGTGTWTVRAAMEEGIALPTITAAVDARILSSLKAEREKAALAYPRSEPEPLGKSEAKAFLIKLEKALYASKICSYAQGFALMKKAGEEKNYNLDLAEIARIWKNGCIIRAVFLDRIRSAFSEDKNLANLLMNAGFQKDIQNAQDAWKDVLSIALDYSIPTPALSASYNYFLSYSSKSLPANLIQGQRDYFGAHTYERLDKQGVFHTEWPSQKETSA